MNKTHTCPLCYKRRVVKKFWISKKQRLSTTNYKLTIGLFDMGKACDDCKNEMMKAMINSIRSVIKSELLVETRESSNPPLLTLDQQIH